jgi:L-malate glycosyltransferase
MKDKPTICFVGPMLGVHSGWVPSPAELLAPRLRTMGYNVHLTSSQPHRYIRLLDMLATIVRQHDKIDLVCIQTYSGPSFVNAGAASWLAQRLGLKPILVLHGGALPEFAAQHPVWVKRVFQRAHLLTAPSNYLAAKLQPLGFPIRVIPNAIDLSDYPYRHRSTLQPHLIWMRTFHEIYHPLMAVQVLEQLLQTTPDARLTMAGQDKGMLHTIKAYVTSHRLEKQVNFIGFLDSDGKKEQFSQHDIYLNTNHVDNTPVSVIEAAAFGLPIVATNVGGIPYLLHHEKDSLLVADGDVQAMAKSVERLLHQPELATHLSKEGRALAERFDWSKVLCEWQSVFQEIRS